MNNTNSKTHTVTFDPGFAKHYPPIDSDTFDQLEFILKNKIANQKKFQLISMENTLVKQLKTLSAIYHSCVIYGSIIAAKYKNNPAEIHDNQILNLSEEQRAALDLTEEVDNNIAFYHKINKSIEFICKRKSKLICNIEETAALYREFVTINNHFKEVRKTDQIKLPDKVKHFFDYTDDCLIDLEKKATQIAQSGNIEEMFNIS
jgi:hypothetical protein